MYDEDLLRITKDRDQTTPELYPPNDFYGNAKMLKEYAGLSTNYPLKLVITHAPYFPKMMWELDLKWPFSFHLTSSEEARNMAQKTYPWKKFFAFGPHIAYAPLNSAPDVIGRIRKNQGKNLLVFLPHSSHHIAVEYDIQAVLRKILEIGKEFSSITVCLYWKNTTQELIDLCTSHGLKCVSAGHMFDLRFMSRLKTILHCADAVATWGYTSAVVYACYLKKPIMVRKVEDLYYTSCGDPAIFDKFFNQTIKKPEAQLMLSIMEKLYKEMRDFRDEPTPLAYELLNLWAGFDQVKTRDEILEICLQAEEAFSSLPMHFLMPVSAQMADKS